MGSVPPAAALVTNPDGSTLRACMQIGHTRNWPPAFSYRCTRSARGGQPSQATALANPSVASRTASFVRNISVCRPCSAAPTATRNATVTVSASSRPVLRVMTALCMMGSPSACWWHVPPLASVVAGDSSSVRPTDLGTDVACVPRSADPEAQWLHDTPRGRCGGGGGPAPAPPEPGLRVFWPGGAGAGPPECPTRAPWPRAGGGP